MNGDGLEELVVLIVDDEKEMRLIMKSVLQDMGIRNIIEAEDAKHAHHILRYAFGKVDIILCDWNLPGESGMEFLHDLRGEDCRIPFLVISGRGDSQSVTLAKEASVAGYILKPFTPEQLEARIRGLLHRVNGMKACEN